jgi:hypothetical protein
MTMDTLIGFATSPSNSRLNIMQSSTGYYTSYAGSRSETHPTLMGLVTLLTGQGYTVTLD